MKERTFILLSVPDDFIDKFSGFISNINTVNSDLKEMPVKIENVFRRKKPEFAAVPKQT